MLPSPSSDLWPRVRLPDQALQQVVPHDLLVIRWQLVAPLCVWACAAAGGCRSKAPSSVQCQPTAPWPTLTAGSAARPGVPTRSLPAVLDQVLERNGSNLSAVAATAAERDGCPTCSSPPTPRARVHTHAHARAFNTPIRRDACAIMHGTCMHACWRARGPPDSSVHLLFCCHPQQVHYLALHSLVL